MAAKQVYRYLRGYTLDPGFSTQLDTMGFNQTTYRIKWENFRNVDDENLGLSGEYFEVIDFDPSSNCYYEPVYLDSVEVLSQNGLTPSEGNPQFHQQFVYTIAMKTLEHFEQSLGRKLIWNPRLIRDKNEKVTGEEYVDKIRLYPHAFRGANAYYTPDKKSVLFGYFKSAPRIQGVNFPGGAVFSCLSPDIVSHEVTHAILDSVHPRFIENTNADVPAFHEAFADIIALLQRFTINELVVNQFSKTAGSLDQFNFLGELATQFGNALANRRGALRSAIGTIDKKEGKWKRKVPDPSLYQTAIEAHERGSILVATFFDALIKVYNYRTQDLIRVATNGSGVLPQGTIQLDLAKRLAQEVCEIAEHLMHIAIRALDYCPPVDITFGEYLRALITADIEFTPSDDNNYRVALIDAFRSWGIFPNHVNTFSEESLQWSAPDDLTKDEKNGLIETADFLRDRVRSLSNISDRAQIFEKSKVIQSELHNFLLGITKTIESEKGSKTKISLGEKERKSLWLKLGLSANRITFVDKDGKELSQFIEDDMLPIEIHKIKPAYRVGRAGMILEQVIVTITQSASVLIDSGMSDPTANGSPKSYMKFRGGCTIVFNMANDFKVSYIIKKSITSRERFIKQLSYQQGENDAALSFSDSMYDDDNGFKSVNFAHLHFH